MLFVLIFRIFVSAFLQCNTNNLEVVTTNWLKCSFNWHALKAFISFLGSKPLAWKPILLLSYPRPSWDEDYILGYACSLILYVCHIHIYIYTGYNIKILVTDISDIIFTGVARTFVMYRHLSETVGFTEAHSAERG